MVANAVDAILTVPKVKPRVEPDWAHKPEYGKTPSYLQRVKAEIEAEHEYIQSLLDQKQVSRVVSCVYVCLPALAYGLAFFSWYHCRVVSASCFVILFFY